MIIKGGKGGDQRTEIVLATTALVAVVALFLRCKHVDYSEEDGNGNGDSDGDGDGDAMLLAVCALFLRFEVHCTYILKQSDKGISQLVTELSQTNKRVAANNGNRKVTKQALAAASPLQLLHHNENIAVAKNCC